jgi:hypothetical protein
MATYNHVQQEFHTNKEKWLIVKQSARCNKTFASFFKSSSSAFTTTKGVPVRQVISLDFE